MAILIVSPASSASTAGNTVTALRYAKLFRQLGHTARIATTYTAQNADCLVALHARKSAKSVLAYRAAYPQRPIILVLTGTDVYRDIKRSRLAERAMAAADSLVVLQRKALGELPAALRGKARVIVQSTPKRAHLRKKGTRFRVAVIGHLRTVKDPMRSAYAVRALPRGLPVEVVQAGKILQRSYERAVNAEVQRNPRYRYAGELPRAKALAVLARSDLLVQSSRIEGGANTVCEAIACGTPVIASHIPGNTGILGDRYPGLYQTGNTKALAALIERAATDGAFYRRLRDACRKLAPLVEPRRELEGWNRVLLGRTRTS